MWFMFMINGGVPLSFCLHNESAAWQLVEYDFVYQVVFVPDWR